MTLYGLDTKEVAGLQEEMRRLSAKYGVLFSLKLDQEEEGVAFLTAGFGSDPGLPSWVRKARVEHGCWYTSQGLFQFKPPVLIGDSEALVRYLERLFLESKDPLEQLAYVK